MTNEQQEGNNSVILNQLGGVRDIASLPAHFPLIYQVTQVRLEKILDSFNQDFLRDPKNFFPAGKITSSLLQKKTLNAVAFDDNTGENIGIFQGLFTVCHDLPSVLMSCPSFLQRTFPRNFENGPSCEEVKKNYYHLIPGPASGKERVPLESAVQHSDKHRRVAAEISFLSDLFFHLHEVGHLVNGHLFQEPANLGGKAKTLIEHDQSRDLSADQILEFQFLEVDADQYASMKLFGLLLQSPRAVLHQEFDTETVLKIFAISQVFSFLVLDLESRSGTLINSTTHPSPSLRSFYCHQKCLAVLHRFFPDLVDPYTEIFLVALLEMYEVWDALEWPHLTFSLNLGDLFEVSRKYHLLHEDYRQRELIPKIQLRNKEILKLLG